MPSPELDSYFASVFKPGAAILTSGFKGGGKTHTAMAVCEQLVKGVYPSVGKVRVFTNVIFYHKVHGQIVEECPDGITHITTMKELFPLLVQSLEADRDVVNILVLDEAQNFLNGDSNQVNASVMMKEFLGIIRKFRLVVWFLTPSAKAIGPAFRNYLNDPKYPGNLTAKLKKDLGWNRQYIEENHLPYDPRELMLMKNFDSDYIVLRVPVTEWTQTRYSLKEGQYCYDHEASATFWMGDDFDWTLFSRQIGGVSSMRILEVIKKFYSMSEEAPKETPEQAKRRMEGDTAYRMMQSGMSGRRTAELLGISPVTMKKRISEAGHEVPVSQHPNAPKGYARHSEAGEGGGHGVELPVQGTARQVVNRLQGTDFSTPIYLSNETGDSRVDPKDGVTTCTQAEGPSEPVKPTLSSETKVPPTGRRMTIKTKGRDAE